MAQIEEQSIETIRDGAVTAAEFRAACALFPTGVTVVTRLLPDASPSGMTVSSFTSVSLEPPLILVCIDKRASFLIRVVKGLTFAVNVLREDQEPLAIRFSTSPEDGRFSGVHWAEGPHRVPLLSDCVAAFICTLDQCVEAGDHFVLIGAVQEIRRDEGRALVWCESGYHCLPAPADRL